MDRGPVATSSVAAALRTKPVPDVKVILILKLFANLSTRAVFGPILCKYCDLRVQYYNAFRMLLGHAWRCSASATFVGAHTDVFYALIREMSASIIGDCAPPPTVS